MSDPTRHGQQSPWPGQQPPPQQYYGQAPGYSYGPPPKKKHTVRNVILAIIGVGILGLVGCVAIVGLVANEADKQIKASDNEIGGPKNPLAIKPGQAFEVRGFNYAAGWKMRRDELGYGQITGLKVTNNRAEQDGALVEIKLWKGTEVVALADCTTEQIAPKTTTRISCASADTIPKGFKPTKVTVNDTF